MHIRNRVLLLKSGDQCINFIFLSSAVLVAVSQIKSERGACVDHEREVIDRSSLSHSPFSFLLLLLLSYTNRNSIDLSLFNISHCLVYLGPFSNTSCTGCSLNAEFRIVFTVSFENIGTFRTKKFSLLSKSCVSSHAIVLRCHRIYLFDVIKFEKLFGLYQFVHRSFFLCIKYLARKTYILQRLKSVAALGKHLLHLSRMKCFCPRIFLVARSKPSNRLASTSCR